MNQSTHQPGFNCPECSYFIPIDLTILLSSNPIRCPACLLELHLNREESQEGLAAIQKIADAMAHVENVRTQWE